MSTYVNCGARINGTRPRSKKSLRDELAGGDPAFVEFDPTELGREGQTLTPYDIMPGEVFQVTGPDPYTSRRWYARVTRAAGTWKVA